MNQKPLFAGFFAVSFLFTALAGCVQTSCDLSGEIDNSLGYADDIVVHLVTKDCKTCPWQVKASAYAYTGVKSFCFAYDGDAKLVFDDAERFFKGDEVSDGIGHEFTAGDYTFSVDEDGTIRDSEGNVYSFF
jgi:hypothetical protein